MGVAAEFKGDGSEHHHGIPTRNISDEEYEVLPAEDKVTLAHSPLYGLHGDAAKEGEAAQRRIAREARAEAAPEPAKG